MCLGDECDTSPDDNTIKPGQIPLPEADYRGGEGYENDRWVSEDAMAKWVDSAFDKILNSEAHGADFKHVILAAGSALSREQADIYYFSSLGYLTYQEAMEDYNHIAADIAAHPVSDTSFKANLANVFYSSGYGGWVVQVTSNVGVCGFYRYCK